MEKIRKTVILFLLMLSCSATVSAQASEPIATIPFELEGAHLFISLQVNGSAPLDFIFDTGAGGTVINQRTAESLGLVNKRKTKTGGATGRFKVQVVKKVPLNLSGLAIDKVSMQSAPLAHLERSIGRRIDGIIGYRLLKDMVVRIDYDRWEIDFFASKGFDYTGTGRVLNIKSGSHCSIQADITLDNGETLSGSFLIDNGAGIAMGLCTPFSERHDVASKLDRRYTASTLGYSNTRSSIVKGRVAELRIGDIDFSDVPVSIYSVKSGFFSQKGYAGLIGNPVLKRYTITFDYRAKKSYWELNERFAGEKFNVSCSGIGLELDSTMSRVMVRSIISDSPAAGTDMSQGDELLVVDGISVDGTSLADISALLRQDGKTIEIEYRREGETFSETIVLKEMI